MAQEEVDGRVDGGGGDLVSGVGEDGQFAGGEIPVGDGGFLDGAEGVAVTGQDQGRCGDRPEVVEGVARESGDAIEKRRRY